MGGGLGFLNKKTWHPGRMQNQERLWKAEEDAAAEARQLAELRKKIVDERGREDLKEAAIAGGHQKAADRLDWMYQSGMTARMEADKRNEDAMLGQAPIEPEAEEKETSRLEQATLLPTFYAEDTPAAANETWARLHSDPLFAIRQQEQSARKQVVANPVQMAAIKHQVQALKEAALAKKLAKREAKEVKKAKKAAKKEGKRQEPPVQHAVSNGHTNGHTSSRHSEQEPAAKRQRRSRSPEERHRRHREDDAHRSLHTPSAGTERDSARHRAEQDSTRLHGERDSSRHRAEADKPAHSAERHASGHADAAGSSRHRADGAAAQGSGVKYGLNENRHQSYDRSEAAEATRRRLEEAAKAKAEADRAAAEARHQRRDYSTGRLTAEEKAARLAEMSGNAAEHEDTRSSRLKHAASQDAASTEAEGAAGTRHHSDAAKFMKGVTKEIYGTVGEASLEDRVSRRKYYIERGGTDDRNAFRRG